MASPSNLPSGEDLVQWDLWKPSTLLVTALMATTIIAYVANSTKSHWKRIPILNPVEGWTSWSDMEAKRTFLTAGRELMRKGRAKFPTGPFRIRTDLGEVLMLPPGLANEIRNAPELSFGNAMAQDFHANIPGFSTADQNNGGNLLLQHVARKQLTKYLSVVTEPLSEETAFALSINFGESTEWREISLKSALQDVIARISSRVFLGELLCRNETWLRITKEYTSNFMYAATALRLWPRPLRRIVHWFLPECRTLREQLADGLRTIGPVLEERRQAKQAALAEGKPVPTFNDALEWADEEAAGLKINYDPAVFQLNLSLAAIHTTTDLTEQFMLDLAANPEYFAPLREEVVRCLSAYGWKKTSLYNMKLLDSAIKESQRKKPSSIASMRRLVERDLTLSNGIILKKGDRVGVDSHRMWDPTLHADPQKWDPYRFLTMRYQDSSSSSSPPSSSYPKKENHLALLVTTSPDHLGFGHGDHGCPGRFFAANEVKIALCHLLMKYDWKLVPGTETDPAMMGLMAISSPTARIIVRRRESVELDLDSI